VTTKGDADASQDGEWAVVRLGVDGSMEYAVAPRRRSMDGGTPFQLQTR
jgi:hypothetical protein